MTNFTHEGEYEAVSVVLASENFRKKCQKSLALPEIGCILSPKQK